MKQEDQLKIDSKKEELKKQSFRERLFLQIEISIWIGISMVNILIGYYNQLKFGLYGTSNEIELINLILLNGLFFIFPLLSKIIFGYFPLEYLRKKFGKKYTNDIKKSEVDIDKEEIAFNNSEEYLVRLSLESGQLSKKIYNRSAAYLFIGSIIALVGVVYFSVQTFSIIKNISIFEIVLVHTVPRIAALIFIEYVAFFFLKQYRITMDEFKYYESIKRQRESNIIIIKLFSKINNKNDQLDLLVKNMSLFDSVGLLKDGETTELIESRKYSNEELDLINNIVNQISKLKP